MSAEIALPVIETDRLRLRPFIDADRDDLIRIAGNRSIADATISVPHPFTAQHATDWIDHSQSETLASAHIGFAVADKGNALLGYVGLHDINREHLQAELSFWIDPTRQGQGIAGNAAIGMLDFAFGILGMNRICAHHMVSNLASGRLLAKLGFVEEGYLRQRVRKWDQFEDVKLWALLR
jgi:[ribosomal protein S5]-alanine N-acetyltransferase